MDPDRICIHKRVSRVSGWEIITRTGAEGTDIPQLDTVGAELQVDQAIFDGFDVPLLFRLVVDHVLNHFAVAACFDVRSMWRTWISGVFAAILL